MRLLHTEDTTANIERQPSPIDEQSLAAAEVLQARRPPLNFIEMGIPLGARLDYRHGEEFATVTGPRKIAFNGEEQSLTALTKRLMGIEHSIQPTPHWMYDGKRLSEIYDEAYGDPEL